MKAQGETTDEQSPKRGQRVGLLVPSSNTVMEVDLYRGLPSGLTVHTARMHMEDTTAAGESRMLDEFAVPAARDLATARPDVVVFGCTSAGALRGNAYDAELCQRISETTGVPTISTIGAVRQDLASMGGYRVGVVTPYTDELNQPIRVSLEADGLKVVSIHGLGITVNFEIAEVTPTDITRFAAQELEGLDLDCLFVSCTNFRGVEALPLLQSHFDLPCVTSNQAVLNAVSEFFGAQ